MTISDDAIAERDRIARDYQAVAERACDMSGGNGIDHILWMGRRSPYPALGGRSPFQAIIVGETAAVMAYLDRILSYADAYGIDPEATR